MGIIVEPDTWSFIFSREYALRYHGLIPEQVPAVTAMTTGRSRSFKTPLGLFDFTLIPLSAYVSGIDLVTVSERSFFMASAKKALAVMVYVQRGLLLRSRTDVERFLYDCPEIPRWIRSQLFLYSDR